MVHAGLGRLEVEVGAYGRYLFNQANFEEALPPEQLAAFEDDEPFGGEDA